jgi:hypothetical protein
LGKTVHQLKQQRTTLKSFKQKLNNKLLGKKMHDKPIYNPQIHHKRDYISSPFVARICNIGLAILKMMK